MMSWIGILVCLSQSAIFSGLTIGLFGLSRLRLEVQAEGRNKKALSILRLRKDAHFLLATLIWGNVSVNVLLTLLTNNVMTGFSAFLFSTLVITIIGEVFPQAFFSRYAMNIGVFFIPLVRIYQFLLFPVAKPTAMVLDLILGVEGVTYFKESEIRILLKHHVRSVESDLDTVEGLGAANFLDLDDILLEDEGEIINDKSIIQLPSEAGLPVFPNFKQDSDDPFLQQVHASEKKWVILTDESNFPLLVLNSDDFLRDALYEDAMHNSYYYCHRPILVTQNNTKLGDVIRRFKVRAEHSEDDVIDNDLILFWGDQKRIITGADLLGRLLRGIASRI